VAGCGLRVGEAVRVEVRDLHESRSPHPRLHVRCGKGGGDRFVPLIPRLVQRLRQWWRQHRHPTWLFPGPGLDWRERGLTATAAAAKATTHLSVSAVQNRVKGFASRGRLFNIGPSLPVLRLRSAIRIGSRTLHRVFYRPAPQGA